MKAIQLQRFGDPADVIRFVELPDIGDPGRDEIIIETEAAPINGTDFLITQGMYGKLPAVPAILGYEGVGRVVAVGREVRHVKEGDRTLIPVGEAAFAERVKTKATWLRPLPEGDVHQLAMLGINPATAYLMLTDAVKLARGDWVIQNGATSAVGRAAIVIAKSLGLRTVNVVRKPEVVAELKALGGDIVLVDGPNLAKEVAVATDGAPIPLAFDMVAGDATLRLQSALAPGGTIVVYSIVSREPGRVNYAPVIFTGQSLRGFWMVNWLSGATVDRIAEVYGALAPMVASGAIKAPIAAVLPFERCGEAFQLAARRDGKVILTPR